MEKRNPTSAVKKNTKKAPRKDAPQLALSIVEQITGGKLKERPDPIKERAASRLGKATKD